MFEIFVCNASITAPWRYGRNNESAFQTSEAAQKLADELNAKYASKFGYVYTVEKKV
jgi:hypothetical protein